MLASLIGFASGPAARVGELIRTRWPHGHL